MLHTSDQCVSYTQAQHLAFDALLGNDLLFCSIIL